ncbi:MAG TPA: alpha/beta hydrolase [Ktedonobacterales bacterium]|nr:alpha/beta hydrolase [Ktedonobacterales bacterium]
MYNPCIRKVVPYITNADVKLYYEVEGEGPPLVLHTGGGGAGSMWRDGGYVTGLTGFQCILFDHRGHGRSDAPETLESYRIEHYVTDVVSVPDALGLSRSEFWGYSDGAQVGYALAAAHPERVAALVALGTTGDADRMTPAERMEAEDLARRLHTDGMTFIVADAESEGTPMAPWFRKQMLDTDPKAFAREVLAWTDWQGPWSLLPQVACPALLLVGEGEDPAGNTARAAALMPNARSVTLPGLNHITAYEHSDRALAHAVPFLCALHWA